jgi:cytochrome c peroxidase
MPFALLAAILASGGLAACGSDDEGARASAEALTGPANNGRHFFDEALPGTNGRSCATCHAESAHFALSGADAEARFQADPGDLLFHPKDADDPTAAAPTYEHLRRRGLVRVTLALADNLDVIDDAGNVVTNADRTLWVWRGVPTVENTALTAPYQYDGRAATLQAQALGALRDHSQIRRAPAGPILDHLAAFEKTVFSSPRVAALAADVADGRPPRDPDPPFAPGSPEAAGKALFQVACAPCHGGASGAQIVNRAVHAQFFPVLDVHGSPEFTVLPDGSIVTTLSNTHQDDEFLVLGIAGLTYLTQVPPQFGGIPNPDGLDFPHYRLRFYTDGTRAHQVVDLPPSPFDPRTGQPVNGRNFFPQLFSVDPGRAVITGDPLDFEAFDVPQLRGIAHTAPYFHDNSAPDLGAMLDIYSRFILPALPPLGLPPVVPPAGPGLPPESLTAAQKAQLVAYLQRI